MNDNGTTSMEYQQALALHRQGRTDEAARAYEFLLTVEPAHLDALIHLGALRLGQGCAAAAEALLRRAATVAPGSPEALGNLAAALQAQGRHDEAAEHYQRALACKPEMLDARFGLAACLQASGRHEAAIACYEFLLNSDPAHPEANFGLATLLAQLDRGSEAANKYRAALATDPDFAEASFGLGKLLARGDTPEQAVDCFLQALDVDRDYIEARMALATTLAQLHRHEDAMAAFRAVLATEPDHPLANYGLGSLLAQAGNSDEADEMFRAAIAADPNFAEAHHALGRLLASDDTVEQARECFARALEINSDYIEARVALGATLSKLHRDDEAMAAFQAALTADPGHPEAHNGIGILFDRKQHHAEAIAHYRTALARNPQHFDATAGMANAMRRLGRHEEALTAARAALALRPDHATLSNMVGSILAETGAMDEAVAQIRHTISIAPGRPEYLYSLVHLTKVRKGDATIQALEAALPRIGSFSAYEQCLLHFSLAKAYDDIGERDRGFEHQLLGNAMQRPRVEYDEAASLEIMIRAADVFTPEFLAARQNLGDPSAVPVFIVGMPRSGTTLVEQILASHAEVFGAGERLEFSRAAIGLRAERIGAAAFPDAVVTMTDEALRRMGADYVAAMQALAPGATRITDKMPGNFLFSGLIRMALPNARIIHLMRDPVDNCLSTFSKLFTDGVAFSYDLGELGRHHRGYQRLMAHWRSVLPAHAYLEVQYETLVDDLEAQARRIIAHCGLQWDPNCLEFYKTERPVHTASLTQVRQPIYRSSVGRWRPDAALLRPLLEALGEPTAY